MSDNPSTSPGARDIFSVRPFKNSAREYFRKGFEPFPLPAKKKNPPPSGATGHNPKYQIDAAKLDEWMDTAKYDKANIGIKLTEVWVEDRDQDGIPEGPYIVLGIDVDNYTDHEDDGVKKEKRGGEQLAELEEKYGRLPDTWISSARADGVSGIRFFLAPPNLQWRGKAADAIDVIQPGHRFAVVWPSWHPEGGQYLFTQPGQAPDGTLPNLVGYRPVSTKLNDGDTGWSVNFLGEPIRIPDAATMLPLLPDAWINYLTRDRTEFVDKPMNMDISVDEVTAWAKKTMSAKKLCKRTRKMVEFWKARIDEDPSSHDKVLGFHWQFSQMGLLEGHSACWGAIRELDSYWTRAVVKAGKRGPQSAAEEIFRSKMNAWRKARYEWDEIVRSGAIPTTACQCAPEVTTEDVNKALEEKDNLPAPQGRIDDLDKYEDSDWGRSQMFLDMFTVDCVKCTGNKEDVLWYFWNLDGNATRKSRGWVQDNDLAVRLVRAVGRVYHTKYEQLLQQYYEMKKVDPDEAKHMYTERVKPAKAEALKIGNRTTTTNLLAMAQSHEGVRVPVEFFDSNKSLLGFNDGVIVLERGKPWHFREKRFDDRVTKTTGLEFKSLQQLMEDRDPGIGLLQGYLEMFIPDGELANFVQMILGYALYGANPDRKIFFFYGDTSTGKSTLVESFRASLGEYGGTSNSEIFNDDNGGRNPELLKTKGLRMVQLPEFGESVFVENDALKRLASEDTISVRDNYAKANQIENFQHSATFIGPTNNVPKINGVDQAVEYRVLAVPFDQKFEESDKNKDKIELMKTIGRAAVMAWALEGWNRYVDGGQNAFMKSELPPAVADTTRSFIGQMSAIGEFVDDYLLVTNDPKDKLTSAQVYSKYVIWAEREGTPKNKVHTKTKITSMVSARVGHATKNIKIDGKVVRGWSGVKLSTQSSALKNSGFKVVTDSGMVVEVGGESEQSSE